MSLEDALNANTKAVLAHNALLEKMLAAGGKAPAAPAAGAAAGKPAAGAAAGKPAGTKPTAPKKPAEPTLEIVTAKITTFLKTGDAEMRAQRKSEAAEIMAHYGVERFTQIAAEHWPEALSGLEAYEAGSIPGFLDVGGGGDDGDGEEEDSMV